MERMDLRVAKKVPNCNPVKTNQKEAVKYFSQEANPVSDSKK